MNNNIPHEDYDYDDLGSIDDRYDYPEEFEEDEEEPDLPSQDDSYDYYDDGDIGMNYFE